MGTHPIFESDFDCLTDYDEMNFVESFFDVPYYHLAIEVFLIGCIYRLLTIRPKRPTSNDRLSEKERQNLIDEWKPEPLVPSGDGDTAVEKDRLVTLRPNGKIIIDGIECLNFGSFNFLNMAMDEKQSDVANQAIRKYGVGSCGPRGFYGTFDVHLELEKEIAEFAGFEESILYSYGFSAIASAIPAYAKRGDILFVDEEVCFSVQQGVKASRSIVRYFRHNDMDHLESLLQAQQILDAKNPRKANVTRKFIIVEGVYQNSGEIVPLQKLVEFKYKFKTRIFIEESNSFGVLGENGRGICQHCNVDPGDIDLIAAELERAFGSIGGFCAGSTYIIDHQRLSGAGYCFSASLPPYLACAASDSLKRIRSNPEKIAKLKSNCIQLHNELSDSLIDTDLKLIGNKESPIKHIAIRDNPLKNHSLSEIVEKCRIKGIGLTKAARIASDNTSKKPETIRITISSALTSENISYFVTSFISSLAD